MDWTPHVVQADTIWQSSRRFAIPIAECGGCFRSLGISCVIGVAAEVRLHYHKELPSLRIPALDRMRIPAEWFDAALAFHRAFGPVLVHCKMGRNRSSVFAAALALANSRFETERSKWFNVTRRTPHRSLVKSLERWVAARRLDHGMDLLETTQR